MLLEQTRFPAVSVLATESACEALRPSLGDCDDVPVYVAPEHVLRAIVGFPFHRGCLALGVRSAPTSLEACAGAAGSVIVLEGVSDPENVGASFRNGLALGAAAV